MSSRASDPLRVLSVPVDGLLGADMNASCQQTGAQETFAGAAADRLEAVWAAIHGHPCPAEARSLLFALLGPWGSNPVPSVPGWPSDIGDDHSPFEFSVALTPKAPEVRLLVEAQGHRPDFVATRDACLELNESLATRGADLQRFRCVRDLFLPEEALEARFALWHAVPLTPGPLRAKAYLNPQIRGAGQACDLVKAALQRLGMPEAWSTLASAMPSRALAGNELRYFALDLERTPAARVKVYLYLNGATARDIERLAALRPGYVAGEVTEFCRAITGSTGPYVSHPLCVYLAFTGNNTTPSGVTLQIPIRYYASDDRAARDRLRTYLQFRGFDTTAYDRALSAVSRRPLNRGSGLHTYVSLRTGTTPARVTTYFAAELYGARPPRDSGTVAATRKLAP